MKKFVSMILIAGMLFSLVAESATVSTLLAGTTNGGVSVHPDTGDIYAAEIGSVSNNSSAWPGSPMTQSFLPSMQAPILAMPGTAG